MSEALPLMTALAPSQASGSQPQTATQLPPAEGAAQGFPALFAALNLPAQTPAQPLPLAIPAFPAALLDDPAFAMLEEVPAEAAPQTLQMFSAQLQQTGNELPQLGWAGMLAVSDGDTAQAVHLEGDETGVVHTRPAVARDLPSAVQRAQTAAFALNPQPAVPLAQALAFEQQLPNQDLPGLRLERAFLADNAAPLMQTSAPMTSANPAQLAALLDGAMLSGVPTRSDATLTQSLQLPVQHPQWGQQVSDRVHWLISQNIKQADLRLNPPELGSLEVRIQIQGDQANVNFTSPHASVREAVDAAIPRLREMLQEAGLSLGHANVSDQALAQRDSGQSQAGAGEPGTALGADGGVGETEAAEMTPIRTGRGLVDLYA